MSHSSDAQARPRKRVIRVLRWIATVVIVGGVGYLFATTLIRNWDEVTAQNLSFDIRWLIAAVVFAFAVPVSGLLWGRIVRTLAPEASVRPVEAVAVHCASWLLKYIPGQIGSVANKVLWAKKKGISRTLVVITFIYENVFLQVASIVPSMVILVASLAPTVFGSNVTLLLLPVLALVPLGLLLWRPFFHRLIDLPARRILKHPVPAEYFLSAKSTLGMLVAFVVPRIINAGGFLLVCAAVVDVTADRILPFAAAFTLGGAVGILAFLVPSGLGVREAIIVVVLAQYVSTPEAIIISLLARLCSTAGDIGVAAIYAVTRQLIDKEVRP